MSEKKEIKALLTRLFSDKADFAMLFGSWVKTPQYVTEESDVDCGFYFSASEPGDEWYFDLADRFLELSGRKLDIVRLNDADIIIAAQIVATGEEVFVHSRDQFDLFRAQVTSRYLDFKQSRKIIEQNILERPNHGR